MDKNHFPSAFSFCSKSSPIILVDDYFGHNKAESSLHLSFGQKQKIRTLNKMCDI